MIFGNISSKHLMMQTIGCHDSAAIVTAGIFPYRMENIKMNDLISALSAGGTSELTASAIVLTMLSALVSGILVSFTYYYTNRNENCNRNFIITLFMLPIIMSMIILFVGSNVARAFSLAGTVSIIRFRSTAGDPKDIGYIFFAVAAGLCAGIGVYLYGLGFVAVLSGIMIIAERSGIIHIKSDMRLLKITIPEDLNYHEVFYDIFEVFTQKHMLKAVKTADLGSVYILTYHVLMRSGVNEKEMLDQLRCRNANLDITYAEIPQVEK